MLRHHKSIKTLPLHNWREVHTDVRWCRFGFDEFIGDNSKKNPKGNTKPSKDDHAAYLLLQEDYVSHFGLSSDTLRLNRLETQLAIHRVNAMTSRIHQNEVNRIEAEIKDLINEIKQKTSIDIEQSLIDVEIWLGREIDPYRTTVFKFNTIIKRFEKHCADQNAAYEKSKAK
tara:strand:- start:674 stop:1189 length:516 start_codon:yes stop_codon:yes gene_type:complete